MVRIVEAAEIKLNPGEAIVKEDSKYTLVDTGRNWQGQKLYQAFNNYNICIGSILAKDDNEATDKLEKKAFEESLNIEEVCSQPLEEASSPINKELTGYIDTIVKGLTPLYKKAQEICKKVHLDRNVEGKFNECSFSWYGASGIKVFASKGANFALLMVDGDFTEWTKMHGHLADSTPKPALPLLLRVKGHTYALKDYYTENEFKFVDKEIGNELAILANAIKNGDVEKAAAEAFQKADPSATNESFVESFDDWYEELNTINS